MKTDVIVVSSRGGQMDTALAQAEWVAQYKGLDKKSALHLRLLAEEMMGMMRAIAGDVEGKFWIEDENNEFEMHLQVTTDMDMAQREKLISASTSGQNEAHRGFMGKIRAFFEPVDDVPVFFDAGMPGSLDGMNAYSWSMQVYREQLQQHMRQEHKGAAEAWDELEKSVVSRVADDVKVSIRGRTAELVICKKIG